MYKHQEQVKEFHKKFDLIINDKPSEVDGDTLKLRCKLLLSETLEFIVAAGFMPSDFDYTDPNDPKFTLITTGQEPNLVKMVDALGDIQYVNDGAAVSLGVDLEPIANEIQRSNMTKLWSTQDIAAILDSRNDWTSTGSYLEGFCVKDKSGKVLKSPSYSPANIEQEIQNQLDNNKDNQ